MKGKRSSITVPFVLFVVSRQAATGGDAATNDTAQPPQPVKRRPGRPRKTTLVQKPKFTLVPAPIAGSWALVAQSIEQLDDVAEHVRGGRKRVDVTISKRVSWTVCCVVEE